MSASRSSSFRAFFRSSSARRGLAACAVVLAAGGLVLARAPHPAGGATIATTQTGPAITTPNGPTSASFTGAGAHGRLALSHGKLLAGAPRTFYAELTVTADAADEARQRAPLSLAVVLDTSGSMGGEKIEQAKSSVIQLIRDMHADDEIAVIRYDSDSTVVQPLARVGAVRDELVARIRNIESGGGTNIHPALQKGVAQLDEAGKGRVRRVVLVSDGLDSTRAQSEDLARACAQRGITVSSMGIGLDFDEAYMGAVAQKGRGNFAFVKDAGSLAGFLRKELHEGATTTIESATAKLQLPDGMQIVRVIGADVRDAAVPGVAELALGSLFAGDERRVIVELRGEVPAGELRAIRGEIAWTRVGGGAASAKIDRLDVGSALTQAEVEEARDGMVFASAISAVASIRQLEATDAYSRGESGRAQALINENESALAAAATAAPAAAPVLQRQLESYAAAKRVFAAAPPKSDEGKAAAKAAAARDVANMARPAF